MIQFSVSTLVNQNMATPQILTISILLMIGLIILNAFFVASEYILVNMNLSRAKDLLEQGKIPKRSVFLLENKEKYIRSAQSGNALSLLGIGWISALSLSNTLKEFLKQFMPEDSALTVSMIAIFLIVAYLYLVLSKNIPQFISIKYTEKILSMIVLPLKLYTSLISPFLWVMKITNNFALKIIKTEFIPGETPALSEQELKRMIAKSEDEGLIDTEEEEMLFNVFEFQDLLAKEIMTPRPFVISLEINSNYQKVIDIAHETGYSRFPIYEERFDNVLGVVHVKDLTLSNNNGEDFILKDVMRKVLKIPETKSVFSLLRNMQHSKIQLAIIFDEFGVISGIITLEDILEELVGEIEDEYDKEADIGIKKLDELNYLVRGELNVGELKKELGIEVETNGVISAGGFLIEKFEHIPSNGEKIEYNNDEFEVMNVQNNRITLIKITLSEKIKYESEKIKEEEENNLED